MEFDSNRIKDPHKFIDELYRRLVGLKGDLESFQSKQDSLEYHSGNGLGIVDSVIKWMISQQS